MRQILFAVAYGVLVLVLALPRGRMERMRPHEAPSAISAFVSAFTLPFGGSSPLPSWLWAPLALASALLIIPKEKRKTDAAPAVGAAICVLAFLLAMRSFMLRTGVPGELWSIEGMSAAWRLGSLGLSLYVAQAAFACCLWSVFTFAYRGKGMAGALLSFSLAGFWVVVFVLPLLSRGAAAIGASGRGSLALQIIAALTFAAALARVIPRWQGRRVCAVVSVASAVAGMLALFVCA